MLAGDIGGTKTYLGLFEGKAERSDPVKEERFWNADFESFEEILQEFLTPSAEDTLAEDILKEEPSASEPHETDVPPGEEEAKPTKWIIDAACFGVAGPVVDNRCRATNLPWTIDGTTLAAMLDTPHVRIVNDVEAMALGVLVLQPEEIENLNPHAPGAPQGTKALLAPGTGLGEAILFWDGHRYHSLPSEGGHASFAPTSDIEIELLRYLRATYLHVSFERVLSGEGLHAIYQFLRDTKKNEPTWFAEKLSTGDPGTLITEAALNGKPEICVQVMELFVSILGNEAGNLALKALARGGVYLGGGIAPRIISKLRDDRFLQAFVGKGRYKRLLTSIPVYVILNDKAALLGAASLAYNTLNAAL
ncbi:MAG: glucokinase [Nitrospirae bacterium]|nr:MAG: glucokinase [Nitrospirota bacterium]